MDYKELEKDIELMRKGQVRSIRTADYHICLVGCKIVVYLTSPVSITMSNNQQVVVEDCEFIKDEI